MKVILNTIMVVCAGILLAMVGLVYHAYEYGVPDKASPLKELLENYGLNLLGDSLAGIMALVTLLVVAGTFAHQIEQSKQTVKEMKEQNAIAKAVARANYKLSLFDKRSNVYQELNEISMMVNASGTFEQDAHKRFVRAGLSAKNIFGGHKKIEEWVDHLLYLGKKVRTLHLMIESYEDRQVSGAFGEREQEKLQEYRQELAEKNMELVDVYDWDVMDGLFLPYIRLETDIVVTENQ
ncbi:hypothetical protein [Agrobacterium tumefaciens]|uniref:hypothetical protein n=1 Tax=Agrobacterium tumefaciens TaxID=358 RepID=UPI000DD08427|nr:hypothetical protein FY143_19265 [Agrobacterium tumefaciens]UXT83584.1 hypothetical protein FY131_19140 [Agrobacterium tumefaciens]